MRSKVPATCVCEVVLPPNQIKRVPFLVIEATPSAQSPFTVLALKLMTSDTFLTGLYTSLPPSRASDVLEYVKVRTPCALAGDNTKAINDSAITSVGDIAP